MTFGDLVVTCKGDFNAAKGRSGPFGTISTIVFRLGQYTTSKGLLPQLLKLPYRALDILWLRLLMGAEIPATLSCGPRLVLCHGARGVIINPRTVIGADATILHHVTIGNAAPGWECPTIGDRAFIGAKASIIGRIVLGHDVTVGAHALVTRDVPSNSVARGVPARNYLVTGPASPKGGPVGPENGDSPTEQSVPKAVEVL